MNLNAKKCADILFARCAALARPRESESEEWQGNGEMGKMGNLDMQKRGNTVCYQGLRGSRRAERQMPASVSFR